jgi:hypothetical protein
MSLAIELQINSSSPAQQHEIINRVVALVQNNGFTVDQSSYTPSVEVQGQLAVVETSRATIKTYES